MYVIAEMTTPTTRRVFKSFPSFVEAVDYAKANFPIVHFEQDGCYAADFLTKFGTVYAIETAQTHDEADGITGAPVPGWAR